MKAPGIMVVLLGLQLCQPVVAASLFRCEYSGRVEFSDRPCQPAKPRNACSEKDGKDAQCSTRASDASRSALPSAVAPLRAGSAMDLPGRLVLDDSARSVESKQRVVDLRNEGVTSAKIANVSDGRGKN